MNFKITLHAALRFAQRNLSDRDIGYILLYGQYFHKSGVIIVYLRQKDVPHFDQANQRYQKLIGTTVVMTRSGHRRIITAYRNRQTGLRHIKRQRDYGRDRKKSKRNLID
ncbi:MAG: hypothetical protein AAF629_25815 [Chloroflexota bacterium]